MTKSEPPAFGGRISSFAFRLPRGSEKRRRVIFPPCIDIKNSVWFDRAREMARPLCCNGPGMFLHHARQSA